MRSASVFRTLCFDLEAALFFDGSYLDWLFADGLLFDDEHALHGGFDAAGRLLEVKVEQGGGECWDCDGQ